MHENQQRQSRTKQLDSERVAISLQYDELRSFSEQQNNDLQWQINELEVLLADSVDSYDSHNRKRVKRASSASEVPSISQNNLAIVTSGPTLWPD